MSAYASCSVPPGPERRSVPVLNLTLSIGVLYVALDTLWSHRGKVFLSDWPLAVSLLEAFFIGLLCYFDYGQDSAFRFYYFLSLLVFYLLFTRVSEIFLERLMVRLTRGQATTGGEAQRRARA